MVKGIGGSSLRNAIKRRTYKERSQPTKRNRLGLLEKKKDYIKRARDYQSKQRRLRALKTKAVLKNPDEFYFGMKNATIKDGAYISTKVKSRPTQEQLKIMKTQDIGYLTLKKSAEMKKIERLQSSLHFLDTAGPKKEIKIKENNAKQYKSNLSENLINSDENFDSDDDMSELDGITLGDSIQENNENNEEQDEKQSITQKHIIFVDNEKDLTTFDPVQHFNTLPEFIDRVYNRPRKDILENQRLIGPNNKKALDKIFKKGEKQYHELAQRVEREKNNT